MEAKTGVALAASAISTIESFPLIRLPGGSQVSARSVTVPLGSTTVSINSTSGWKPSVDEITILEESKQCAPFPLIRLPGGSQEIETRQVQAFSNFGFH